MGVKAFPTCSPRVGRVPPGHGPTPPTGKDTLSGGCCQGILGSTASFHVILSENEDMSPGGLVWDLAAPPSTQEKPPIFTPPSTLAMGIEFWESPRCPALLCGDRCPQCGDRQPVTAATAPQHPPTSVTPKAPAIPAGPGGWPGSRWVSRRGLRGRSLCGAGGRGAAAAAGPAGDAEHSWRAGYIWSGFQRAGPGPAPPPPGRESAPAAEPPAPGAGGVGSAGNRALPHPFSAHWHRRGPRWELTPLIKPTVPQTSVPLPV